jgi:hypothetical protein
MKAVLSATNMLNNVEQCNRKLYQVRFLQIFNAKNTSYNRRNHHGRNRSSNNDATTIS